MVITGVWDKAPIEIPRSEPFAEKSVGRLRHMAPDWPGPLVMDPPAIYKWLSEVVGMFAD